VSRRPTFRMAFEVERGTASVEYECEFTVSPGERERGPTYDCGGTPAYPPEVESKAVFYVFKKACPACKGKGLTLAPSPLLATLCPKCGGRKRVTVREERPELADMVDDDELLEHAGSMDVYDGPDTTAEMRGER
jgi:DnaJ-class molecular chaperone